MGSMVILFTLVNLLFKPPALPDEWDTPAQVVTGTAAGFMGGITAIWSPPVMIFLLARRTPKDAFVRASGVIIAVGGVPLIISYWQAGLFGGETAIVSCLMVMPAVVGFFVGERLRSRLDAKRFSYRCSDHFPVFGAEPDPARAKPLTRKREFSATALSRRFQMVALNIFSALKGEDFQED